MSEPLLDTCPSGFAQTTASLHSLAEKVISPARAAATGHEFSLVATKGGFGTPALPDGSVIRVEATTLVVERPGADPQIQEITSLKAAGEFVGLEAGDLDDAPLIVDVESALVLASAYEIGDSVLRELAAEAAADASPSAIRLWPEHFDIAFEQGDEAAGKRAGYGLSPGDEEHDEPYFYVGPWVEPTDLSGWSAVGFTGAELRWDDLAGSSEPRALALAFLRERRDALAAAV